MVLSVEVRILFSENASLVVAVLFTKATTLKKMKEVPSLPKRIPTKLIVTITTQTQLGQFSWRGCTYG